MSHTRPSVSPEASHRAMAVSSSQHQRPHHQGDPLHVRPVVGAKT